MVCAAVVGIASAMANARLQLEYKTGIYPIDFGNISIPRPCKYCGRTKQKDGHKSCDGCGAPREYERTSPTQVKVSV